MSEQDVVGRIVACLWCARCEQPIRRVVQAVRVVGGTELVVRCHGEARVVTVSDTSKTVEDGARRTLWSGELSWAMRDRFHIGPARERTRRRLQRFINT